MSEIRLADLAERLKPYMASIAAEYVTGEPAGGTGGGGGMEVHDIDGAWHTVTGSQWDVVGLTGANTLGLLTPSSDPTGQAILMSDANGRLGLEAMGLGGPAGAYDILRVTQSGTNPSGGLGALAVTVNVNDNTTYYTSGTFVMVHSQSIGDCALNMYNLLVRYTTDTTVKHAASVYNVMSEMYAYDSGDVGTFYHFLAGGGYDSGSNTTIDARYGLKIDSSAFVVTGSEYGIYMDNINQGGTNNYAIYTNEGYIRFGDTVAIGAINNDFQILKVAGTWNNPGSYVQGIVCNIILTDTTTDFTGIADVIYINPSGATAESYFGLEIQNIYQSSYAHTGIMEGIAVRAAQHTSTGSVQWARGIHINDPIIGSGSITNYYGLMIDSSSFSATSKYALHIGNFSGGSSNNYSIYTDGGVHRLGDRVEIFAQDSTASATANQHGYGIHAYVYSNNFQSAYSMCAIYARPYFQDTTSSSLGMAGMDIALCHSTSATLARATGATTSVYLYGGGTISQFFGFEVGGGYFSSGGSVTYRYGLRVYAPASNVVNNYAIYVDNQTAASGATYSIYTEAGNVSLGDDLEFRQASAIETTSGNLTLSPAGDIVVDPTGEDVLPANGYVVNLGSLQYKYLTLHAAELWVETLVAQDTLATIGGRVLVGPTTMLEEDMLAATDEIVDGSFESGPGSNLILNPSFETAGGGGSDVFANWTEVIGSGGAILRDGTSPLNGSYSAKLTQGTTDTYVYQNFSVTQNKPYTFYFYTRGDGTYAGRYKVRNVTGGSDIIAVTSTGVPGTSWTAIRVQFTTPAGCSTVGVYLYAPSGGSGRIASFDYTFTLLCEWTNWTRYAAGGYVMPDPYTVAGGSTSVCMVRTSGDSYVYQDVSVTEGERFGLKFYCQGSSSVAGRYRIYDITHSTDIIATTSTGNTGGWLPKSVGFTIPSGCTSIRIYFYNSSSAGTIWWDGVNLYEGTMVTKHNNLSSSGVGDFVYMEANGKVEFMKVLQGPSGSGPYTYTVARDLDQTGANAWYKGDAIFNTGQTGDGFIDLYSVSGVYSGSGPTIVGNERQNDENNWDYYKWEPRWAIGNLNGLYNVGSNDVYGVAFGDPSATYVQIDATSGIQFYNTSTNLIAQWDTSGTIILGKDSLSHIELDGTNGIRIFKDSTTVTGQWSINGDILLGETTSNYANMFYDQSEGLLTFRRGTDSVISISTTERALYITDPAYVTFYVRGYQPAAGHQRLHIRGWYPNVDSRTSIYLEAISDLTGTPPTYSYIDINAHGASADEYINLYVDDGTYTNYLKLQSGEVTTARDLTVNQDVRVLQGLFVGADTEVQQV